MLKTVSLSALLLVTCAATADEPKPPVSLEATIVPPKQKGFIALLTVRLVGAGKDASFVTEGLRTTVARDGKTATLTIRLDERKDEKGRLVVPSATHLGIVTLQPGEVAGVRLSTGPGTNEVLAAAAAGEVELTVEYEVSEAWAKRFGVVGGKVRGAATVGK